MKKVVVIGAGGRMGRTIMRCLLDGAVEGLALHGGVDRAESPDIGTDLGELAGARPVQHRLTSELSEAIEGADVCIDFSFHTATAENARLLAECGVPVVIGTTGFCNDELALIEAAAKKIPVVMAPNMSLGVNLLFCLVEQAARALKGRGYDVEIIERHHRKKKDAPSGTALGLGKSVAAGLDVNLDEVAVHGRSGVVEQERSETEIGFHAFRGGDIVGDHTVVFAADGECVELGHRATSRDTFAIGSLKAASWVAGQAPGLYSMLDVLGLNQDA